MMARAAAVGRWLPLTPLLLVPLLLPVGRLSEFGVLIGLVAGLVFMVRRPREVARQPAARLFLLLFVCYAGAALWSLPGAVAPDKSATTALALWRFLPFGLFACLALRPVTWAASRIEIVLAAVVALWALDAWVQIATGWSLGGAADAVRITGVFGADNLKLGLMLALLAPFLLAVAQRRLGWRGVAAGFVFLLGPVLLAGSRQGWLQFALVALAAIWIVTRSPWRRAALIASAGLAGVVVLAAAWQLSPGFAQRMDRTTHVLDADAGGLDWALSGRLRIWRTTGAMIAADPVNGVGVRGYRYAYPVHAQADDSFVGAEACGVGQGACHPHQWVLEVMVETGVAGLALWLIGIGAALRAWWRSPATARRRAWPFTVALATLLFPLNTHLALYSSWSGLVLWWLIALWCAVLLAPEAAEPVPAARA